MILIECSGYEIIIDKTQMINLKEHQTLIRDNYSEVVYDTETALLWQDNSEVKSLKKDWKNANTYCEKLNFGGYDDWYLPTISELESIADYDKYEPAIKKGFKNILPNYYWSSTSYIDNSGYVDKENGSKLSYKDRRYEKSEKPNAWTVNFMYGSSYYQIRKISKRNIRCVRKER